MMPIPERKFRKGDVVMANGSKTLMSIERPSEAITSEKCWVCSFISAASGQRRERSFLESTLTLAKPETPRGAA